MPGSLFSHLCETRPKAKLAVTMQLLQKNECQQATLPASLPEPHPSRPAVPNYKEAEAISENKKLGGVEGGESGR